MVALIIIVLLLIVTAVTLLWPMPDATAEGESVGKDRAGDGAAGRPAPPTTLEGALSAQLIGGQISRQQYRRALSRLAVRDDEQHPLSVPRSDLPGTG